MYRDDWAALGIPTLHVTNSIWVHQGRIANFTSHADNSREAERLGDLWSPREAGLALVPDRRT